MYAPAICAPEMHATSGPYNCKTVTSNDRHVFSLLFRKTPMNTQRLMSLFTALLLIIGVGSTQSLWAQPEACVKNNNTCTVSVTIYFSNSEYCTATTLAPGAEFCCPFPDNSSTVSAIEVNGISVSPPAPGTCTGLTAVCPGSLCSTNTPNYWSIQ